MPKIFFTSDKKMCFLQLVIKNILGVFWFVFPSQCLCAIFYLIDFLANVDVVQDFFSKIIPDHVLISKIIHF